MYDVAIVGGGIVGLATALALSERVPRAKLVVLEKEPHLAPHQTGRNSGVIHSGIYYKPGSLKATFAREGNRRMVAFCREHNIPHEVCGKVIVATQPEDLPQLEALHQRGIANGLTVERLSREQVAEIEPHCTALAGLSVKSTGIVNYAHVADAMAETLRKRGTEIRVNARVHRIRATLDRVAIECASKTLDARYLVNCAGLHSDRIARMMDVPTGMRIVPIRGEYFLLRPEKRHLVRSLIYPVPNPHYPFLGVHFTRMVNGDVHAGPNAVLSLKREGYRKTAFSLRDTGEMLCAPSFWRFAAKNWQEGCREIARSISKRRFVHSLQRMIPDIQSEDLVAPHAGVRAQALGLDGRLLDDFVLVPGPRSMHVCNAPSPAATASLCIGDAIAQKVVQHIPFAR